MPKWTIFEISFLWKHQSSCFHYWDYLTNFCCNNWWSIIDIVERLCYGQKLRNRWPLDGLILGIKNFDLRLYLDWKIDWEFGTIWMSWLVWWLVPTKFCASLVNPLPVASCGTILQLTKVVYGFLIGMRQTFSSTNFQITTKNKFCNLECCALFVPQKVLQLRILSCYLVHGTIIVLWK